MCTGVEIAAIIGATASVASATGIIGGKPSTPAVVRESPLADQAKVDAESQARAAQDKQARQRRLRASSLLATGGLGDTTSPVTGQPSAVAGKPTLGA